jgi:hypothetical protein
LGDNVGENFMCVLPSTRCDAHQRIPRSTRVKNKLTSKNELITLFFHAKVSLFLREKFKSKVAPTVDPLPKTTMATLDNDHPSRSNLHPFLIISVHIADPE